MNRKKSTATRITDAIITAVAFTAGTAIAIPVVLVAVFPFAG